MGKVSFVRVETGLATREGKKVYVRVRIRMGWMWW